MPVIKFENGPTLRPRVRDSWSKRIAPIELLEDNRVERTESPCDELQRRVSDRFIRRLVDGMGMQVLGQSVLDEMLERADCDPLYAQHARVHICRYIRVCVLGMEQRIRVPLGEEHVPILVPASFFGPSTRAIDPRDYLNMSELHFDIAIQEELHEWWRTPRETLT